VKENTTKNLFCTIFGWLL